MSTPMDLTELITKNNGLLTLHVDKKYELMRGEGGEIHFISEFTKSASRASKTIDAKDQETKLVIGKVTIYIKLWHVTENWDIQIAPFDKYKHHSYRSNNPTVSISIEQLFRHKHKTMYVSIIKDKVYIGHGEYHNEVEKCPFICEQQAVHLCNSTLRPCNAHSAICPYRHDIKVSKYILTQENSIIKSQHLQGVTFNIMASKCSFDDKIFKFGIIGVDKEFKVDPYKASSYLKTFDNMKEQLIIAVFNYDKSGPGEHRYVYFRDSCVNKMAVTTESELKSRSRNATCPMFAHALSRSSQYPSCRYHNIFCKFNHDAKRGENGLVASINGWKSETVQTIAHNETLYINWNGHIISIRDPRLRDKDNGIFSKK
jgi:hypothetical protein